MLKGLGFLDTSSVPTQAYRDYRDKKAAPTVLAKQLRQAYRGLFLADENAQDLNAEDLKGKFATPTGKDQSVVAKMTSPFKALPGLADFKKAAEPELLKPAEEPVESQALEQVTRRPASLAFAHTIYINLPQSQAEYRCRDRHVSPAFV